MQENNMQPAPGDNNTAKVLLMYKTTVYFIYDIFLKTVTVGMMRE